MSPRPPPFSPRRYPSPGPNMKNRSPTLNSMPEHLHPALQTVQTQYPTQKTRMRTSFDPELELPKLQRWFSENQHPSRQQIQQYVRELNNLESRRGRKPLDVNNVVYWFKNARAAQKRAELRNIGGLGCHLNGFNSRSHSPTNGSMIGGSDSYNPHDHHSMKSPLELSESPGRYPMSVMSEDNLSNNGSDMDDDGVDLNPDDRPESPEAPLSLITTKKNNNDSEEPRHESPKPPDMIKVKSISTISSSRIITKIIISSLSDHFCLIKYDAHKLNMCSFPTGARHQNGAARLKQDRTRAFPAALPRQEQRQLSQQQHKQQ